MPSITAENCVARLRGAKLNVAFAESATAGRVASELSLVQESGSILLGSVVCYDVAVKTQLLKVPQELIDIYTSESAEVTKAMAHGLSRIIESDIQVAVTGLASPGGSETAEKPVGTFFIHIKMPKEDIAERVVFHGSPEQVVLHAVDRTCELLTENIETLIEP